MGPIRRIINLLIALALSVLGWGALIYMLLFGQHFKGWIIMGCAMVGVAGVYWLWTDFINADPRPES